MYQPEPARMKLLREMSLAMVEGQREHLGGAESTFWSSSALCPQAEHLYSYKGKLLYLLDVYIVLDCRSLQAHAAD